jgi:carboxyl-terminal processing protease
MKKGVVILLSAVVISAVLLSLRCTPSNADNGIAMDPYVSMVNEKKHDEISEDKQKAIMNTIYRMITEAHFDPKEINDQYSADVFLEFLKRMDIGKQYFTQKDIDEFEKYNKKLDDAFKTSDLAFFTLVYERFKQRAVYSKQCYNELIAQPFSFDKKGEINIDGDKIKYCKNDKEIKERWAEFLQYRVLAKYAELNEVQNTKKDTVKDWKLISKETLIDSARKLVKKSIDIGFARLDKNSNADYFSMYMNSFTEVMDPHTTYMAPVAKADFDVQMSGTFYGIGASLKDDNGVCIIAQVISGSPCWKQGSLKVDDKILKVGQGEAEPIDIAGWEINDVVKQIRGKKGTEVRLYVKHKDGKDEVVPIIRDEVHLEDVFAKSAILKDGDKKIGYIYLPEFYADFQKANGKRCAVDMRKEILKLKEEGVDGMIVDLRFNGGGSLSDVVDIGGLFMGTGPMVQVKDPKADPKALGAKTSIIYEGPLAVMVNSFSASASEILAAALQDYDRAIVVGSTTHGKGTVQRALDMDEALTGNNEIKPLGSLKITLQKFYRANGGSTQLNGVTPDISLPDLYMFLETGERKDKFALAWDEVKANTFTKSSKINREKIIKASAARIAGNEYFKIVTERAKQIKIQNDDNVYPLKEQEYMAYLAKQKEFNKKLEELDKDKVLIDAYNPRADMDRVLTDETTKKKNEDWLKALKKDENLKETVNIVKDIISN